MGHVASLHVAEGGQLLHRYEWGYAARLDANSIEQLRQRQDVDFIETNQRVSISATQVGSPNWGLDRISQPSLPLNNMYTYPDSAGAGVDVYVIDTGVRIDHVEFQGRARWGITVPLGDTNNDANGHGTHVASTIAGVTYGVAKKANIVAVKVLASNGYGTMADVIAGVTWTATQHKSKRGAKSIANMSLGGGKSTALEQAVERASALGVMFAVAAGNENAPACDSSPAGSPSALTVGATTRTDQRAYYSNWGPCVNIFAPGSDITAAWNTDSRSSRTISGTSMATPHVAGTLALFAAQGNFTPKQLKDMVLRVATPNKVTDPGVGSNNMLLFSNVIWKSSDQFVKVKEEEAEATLYQSTQFHAQW